MITDIKMPQLGESVTEGTVGRWLKQPGEVVQKYEPLLEVITDKVDTEVPAPASGVLLDVLVVAGETVAVGTLLARIGPADAPSHTVSSTPIQRSRTFLSPVVTRMLAEHQLDVALIAGSGEGGRVTKQDVLKFLAQHPQAAPVTQPVPSPAQTAPVVLPPPASQPDSELVPLTPMRRAIAEHMERSIRTAPHVTSVVEVDLSRVVAHRAAHSAAFAAQGVRLTYTPYFIHAAVAGLRQSPVLNATLSPNGIIMYRHIHIGMAVALDTGLIVPVIRHANEKNLLGLARSVNDLAARARTRQLTPDATQGGTFTITNHGTSGSLFANPIINQPQSAILGIGAIVKRPIVVSVADLDAIVIKPMCYLSLTFDHRVADGAIADAFLAGAKRALEDYS